MPIFMQTAVIEIRPLPTFSKRAASPFDDNRKLTVPWQLPKYYQLHGFVKFYEITE